MRAQAIAQATGRSELIARILAGRGVELDAVERHLEPTLRDLMPDPLTLTDMLPPTKKASPPNIRFSLSSGSSASSSRIRLARSWS